MKKVTTAAVKAMKNFFSTEVDDWFGPGRSLQLVLPARRSGRSAAGAETGHDSEGDALPDRAGDRDAFAVGEPNTD